MNWRTGQKQIVKIYSHAKSIPIVLPSSSTTFPLTEMGLLVGAPLPLMVCLPNTSISHSSLPAVSDKCDVPLGVEDNRVPNQFFSASSFYNYYCAPRNARLHQRRAGRNGGAWCARRNDRTQWLQVDFGGLTRVTRISTQGRQNSDQWVTSYYLGYSKNGIRYFPYREGRSTKVTIFLGNHKDYI